MLPSTLWIKDAPNEEKRVFHKAKNGRLWKGFKRDFETRIQPFFLVWRSVLRGLD